MTVSRKFITALRRELAAAANPKAAPAMQAYMKSAMPFYGIKATPLRQIAGAVIQQVPLQDFVQWRDTVLALWRGAKFREERHCAIELCGAKPYRYCQTPQALPIYEEMIVTGAWWDFVDVIAAHRIGDLLKHYPKPMKATLKQWSRCDDIWKRRTAILSQLRFKENTDLAFLYQCIEPSLGSNEFFLQKAIGWALRTYAWCDIDEVIRYVKHQRSLSPLSQREALKNRAKLKP